MTKGKVKKGRRLGFISRSVFLLNVLAAGALIISYLAPYVNPRTFWPIAFFGIGYSLILAINALFVFYWLIRRPVFALLSLGIFVLGWGAFRRHIGFAEAVPEGVVETPDTAHVRVMSFNVHFFSPPNDPTHTFLYKQDILHLIDSISPDILCIQELLTREKGEHNLLATFRDKHGYAYQHFTATAQNDYEAYGMAILSRYPIVSNGKLEEHRFGINRTIYADIAYRGDTIRVYNVHLRSFGFQQEDYEFIEASPKTLEEEVSSTKRIGWRLRHGFAARSEQARALREHSRAVSGPCLVMGDFNDTPQSYAVNQLSQGMQNAFRVRGRGWGETYNGAFPNFQIDYILASREIGIHHYQVVKRRYSDHYPVWADLSL